MTGQAWAAVYVPTCGGYLSSTAAASCPLQVALPRSARLPGTAHYQNTTPSVQSTGAMLLPSSEHQLLHVHLDLQAQCARPVNESEMRICTTHEDNTPNTHTLKRCACVVKGEVGL